MLGCVNFSSRMWRLWIIEFGGEDFCGDLALVMVVPQWCSHRLESGGLFVMGC